MPPELKALFLPHGRKLASGGVYDEAADANVARHKRVVADGVNSLADTLWCVMETFKPMIQINAAMLNQAKRIVRYAT